MRVSATRKRENGGRLRRAFRVANAADKMTKGAMILKICGKLSKHTRSSERYSNKEAHQQGCHQKWIEYRDKSVDWLQIEGTMILRMGEIGIEEEQRTYEMDATLH